MTAPGGTGRKIDDPLSKTEEQELIRRYKSGDKKAGDLLIMANRRFVAMFAARHAWRGLPMEDLIQEGNLGMIRALEKFEPERGWRFGTYAAYWVRAFLQQFVEESSREDSTVLLLEDIPANDREHLLEDAADVAGVEEVLQMVQRGEAHRRVLADALGHLTPKERHVIVLRFLKEPKAKLSDIGDGLGVSRERVRQIEARGLKKLTSLLTPRKRRQLE